MNTNANNSNQSAEKALKILEYLAQQSEPVRLMDIAKNLGMNTSTTLRFLNTLIALEYAAQEEDTSKYYLTYKLVALGHQVNSNKPLQRIISPYLKKLSETINESVCLAIEHNHQVIYIDVVEGPRQIVKAMQRIGNIAPLHCTGIGKLFLTEYSTTELDELIKEQGLQKFTEHTLTTKKELITEIEEVKKRGYAFDNEECEIGAKCIAFPIYDYQKKIIAGISVTGPAIRITDQFAEQWIPYIRQLSEEISRQFGWGQYI